jgi:hypothetical protein
MKNNIREKIIDIIGNFESKENDEYWPCREIWEKMADKIVKIVREQYEKRNYKRK